MKYQTNNTYDTTTVVTNTRTETDVTVEVGEFREKESLNAYIAGNKVHMVWNGKVYVGNTMGMELVTSGPKLIRSIKGRY
jgi:hypothetical protein